MTRPIIQVNELVKTFGSEAAVNGVSLEIYDKEFLALLGPSGCGKTTLLRMLGGFENPTSGSVVMDGKDITQLPPNKRALNMVFQSYAVFPHMSVEDNVSYGLRIDGIEKGEVLRRTEEALELVQMGSLSRRMPHQLSGGQRQRVALARALVKRPRVLLLDEPLSALDAKLREAMQGELVKLQHTVGITFVVVTHDQNEALSMAERVAVMESGVIRQLDTPRNLYEAPANRFVADFVGRMNILPAHRTSPGVYTAEGLGEVRAGVDSADASFVAIRPEKICFGGLGSGVVSGGGGAVGDSGAGVGDGAGVSDGAGGGGLGNQFSAVVEGVSYYGSETVVSVRTAGGALLTVADLNSKVRGVIASSGDKVTVSWSPEDMITLRE